MSGLLNRRSVLALVSATAVSATIPTITSAAPLAYKLNASRSNVGFGVSLGNDTLTGSMPVRSADLSLDFDDISNSRVNVTLNAANTKMGVFFATDAVRSSDLLDVARHPTIQFRSTSVRQGATPSEAIVNGNVTVRGVTRAVTLRTQLTQDRSTVGQANPELMLILRGALNREDFGMSAYKGLVGPMVQLDIRASIKRA